MRARSKRMSILLCFVIVICVVCSIIFINEEVHHDCCGQGCPICRQIHASQNLLNTLKGCNRLTLIGVQCYLFLLSIVYGINILLRQQTLITLKVELLN